MHFTSGNGLCIASKISKVKIIETFHSSTLCMMSVVAIINELSYLFILVYRPPGAIGEFINILIDELSSLPINDHIVFILGDFNIDQRITNNPLLLLTNQTNLIQLSSFSTHRHGGILDIILSNYPAVIQILPVFFSDHSMLLLNL